MYKQPATSMTGRTTVHHATVLSQQLVRAVIVGMLATACVGDGQVVAPDSLRLSAAAAAAAGTEEAEHAAGNYLQPMRPMTWDQSEDHRRLLRHAEALRQREEAVTEESRPRPMTWDQSEDHRRLLRHAEALRLRERAAGDCDPA